MDVLDYNRVLHQRREPARNESRSFRLLREQPGERAMIGTQKKLAAEEIYTKMLERTNDCEASSLKLRIVSCAGDNFFEKNEMSRSTLLLSRCSSTAPIAMFEASV